MTDVELIHILIEEVYDERGWDRILSKVKAPEIFDSFNSSTFSNMELKLHRKDFLERCEAEIYQWFPKEEDLLQNCIFALVDEAESRPEEAWYPVSVLLEVMLPYAPSITRSNWIFIFNYFHIWLKSDGLDEREEIFQILKKYTQAYAIEELPHLFALLEREIVTIDRGYSYLTEIFFKWVEMDLENFQKPSFSMTSFQAVVKNHFLKQFPNDTCPACLDFLTNDLICSQCTLVKYCCRKCQSKHFKLHKRFCIHYKNVPKVLSTSFEEMIFYRTICVVLVMLNLAEEDQELDASQAFEIAMRWKLSICFEAVSGMFERGVNIAGYDNKTILDWYEHFDYPISRENPDIKSAVNQFSLYYCTEESVEKVQMIKRQMRDQQKRKITAMVKKSQRKDKNNPNRKARFLCEVQDSMAVNDWVQKALVPYVIFLIEMSKLNDEDNFQWGHPCLAIEISESNTEMEEYRKDREEIKMKKKLAGINIVGDLSLERCVTCNKEDVKLLLCGSCKAVKYCSKECQKINWEEHKAVCKKLREQRDFWKGGGEVTETVESSEESEEENECFHCGDDIFGKPVYTCDECGRPFCHVKCKAYHEKHNHQAK